MELCGDVVPPRIRCVKPPCCSSIEKKKKCKPFTGEVLIEVNLPFHPYKLNFYLALALVTSSASLFSFHKRSIARLHTGISALSHLAQPRLGPAGGAAKNVFLIRSAAPQRVIKDPINGAGKRWSIRIIKTAVFLHSGKSIRIVIRREQRPSPALILALVCSGRCDKKSQDVRDIASERQWFQFIRSVIKLDSAELFILKVVIHFPHSISLNDKRRRKDLPGSF